MSYLDFSDPKDPPSSFYHLCPFSTSFREIAPSLLVRCTTAKELKFFFSKYDDVYSQCKTKNLQYKIWNGHLMGHSEPQPN